MKGDYEEFYALKATKNKAKQSQFVGEAKPAQAIPKAFGFEAATRPRSAYSAKMRKRSLKKQTQFLKGQNGCNIN